MKYLYIRLDDASENCDIDKWERIEELLDRYNVKPLVGVIPFNQDASLLRFSKSIGFWEKVNAWQKKGWIIACHGYNHVYSTKCGGINPVHDRSEFAGNPLAVQKEKIRMAMSTFSAHKVEPLVFFAPSHTFDKNTLIALKEESQIRIVSDTFTNSSYYYQGFTFVPVQSGRVRNLPFRVVTFCYHPNEMSEEDYLFLEEFLKKNTVSPFPTDRVSRRRSIIDISLQALYRIFLAFKSLKRR